MLFTLLIIVYAFDYTLYYKRKVAIKLAFNEYHEKLTLAWKHKAKQQARANTFSGQTDKLKGFISDKLLEVCRPVDRNREDVPQQRTAEVRPHLHLVRNREEPVGEPDAADVDAGEEAGADDREDRHRLSRAQRCCPEDEGDHRARSLLGHRWRHSGP